VTPPPAICAASAGAAGPQPVAAPIGPRRLRRERLR
jgi:hypothetical protein